MYLKFYNLERLPFENVPDPYFFYYSKEHREALARLEYVVSVKKPLCLLTGEYGSGKTLLAYTLRNMLSQRNFHVAYIGDPLLPPDEFLHHLFFSFSHSVDSTANIGEKLFLKKVEVLHLLCEVLRRNVEIGKHTVAIIDEAHLVENIKLFEEIRVLLNYIIDNNFALTVILMGQTELREKLAALPQLKQRVNYHYHLQNLDLEEVDEYIRHRLTAAGHPDGNIFHKPAVQEIYNITLGLPRSINNLCDVCLMIGFDKGVEKIDKEIVLEAKREVLL